MLYAPRDEGREGVVRRDDSLCGARRARGDPLEAGHPLGDRPHPRLEDRSASRTCAATSWVARFRRETSARAMKRGTRRRDLHIAGRGRIASSAPRPCCAMWPTSSRRTLSSPRSSTAQRYGRPSTLSMFNRRAYKGQCFHRPYLGTREFAADFALVENLMPQSTLPSNQQ